MKRLLLVMVLALASNSFAATVFTSGSRAVGTGTVNLSITTDDTIGVLGNANILDWTIVMDDGTNTFTLNGPLSGNNSQLLIGGAGLSATSTNLLFDYSVNGAFAAFQAPSLGSGQTFYCLQGNNSSCAFVGPGAEVIGPATDGSYVFTSQTGSTLIASAVPEPTTGLLLLSGLGGMFAVRRRKRQS